MGLSKLTPSSVAVCAPTGVKTGPREGLEIEIPEEGPGARPGRTLTAPGIRGTAPGSKAVGLIARLAWMRKEKKQTNNHTNPHYK